VIEQEHKLVLGKARETGRRENPQAYFWNKHSFDKRMDYPVTALQFCEREEGKAECDMQDEAALQGSS